VGAGAPARGTVVVTVRVTVVVTDRVEVLVCTDREFPQPASASTARSATADR
jgi:hypothetical protein